MAKNKAELTSIKIGPHTYSVEAVDRLVASDDAGRRLLGEIDYIGLRIRHDSALVGTARAQTILHEVVHGVLDNIGIRSDHDERLIDSLATGVLMVLRDNPALVRLIQE